MFPVRVFRFLTQYQTEAGTNVADVRLFGASAGLSIHINPSTRDDHVMYRHAFPFGKMGSNGYAAMHCGSLHFNQCKEIERPTTS